jgi:hypothetical protein
MKSLYCIKYKSPSTDNFYWLYKSNSSFFTEQLKHIKNTSLYLELLNTIKPHDSPADAYLSIREFMGYTSSSWCSLSNNLCLGHEYTENTMKKVEFVLVDVTHDFKEINTFKIKDIDYFFLLSDSYDSILAEKCTIEQTSEFSKEAFKRSCYAIDYNKDLSAKKSNIRKLYNDFVDVRNLSVEADKKSNVTQLHPKKKRNSMVIAL